MNAQATIQFNTETGLWQVYFTSAVGGHWSRPMPLANLERVLRDLAYRRLNDGKAQDFAIDREPVARLLDAALVRTAIANGKTIQRTPTASAPSAKSVTISQAILDSLNLEI